MSQFYQHKFWTLSCCLACSACASIESDKLPEEEPPAVEDPGEEVVPTCTDGKQNGSETGVDCGGSCQPCKVEPTEVVDPYRQAKQGEIVITEILNNAQVGERFNGLNSEQSEFIEILNRTSITLSLNKNSIQCIRSDGNGKHAFELEGSIAPNNAVVISNTPIEGLPDGVVNQLGIKMANEFVNDSNFICTLYNKDNERLHRVYFESQGDGATGISEVVSSLDNLAESNTLKPHDSVSRFAHSPGRCKNGGLFVEKCETHCTNDTQDADETDLNCGGASCDLCKDGQKCQSGEDCTSGKCLENGVCAYECRCTYETDMCDETTGKCWSCGDTVKNGDETDADCGGAVCDPCQAGRDCLVNEDCDSHLCENNVCAPKSCVEIGCNSNDGQTLCDAKSGKCFRCDDRIQNGNETGVDCGGQCQPCGEGESCILNKDCESLKCVAGKCSQKPCTMTGCEGDAKCDAKTGLCYSCHDSLPNGDETDIDCGGSCKACALGKTCSVASDCISTNCSLKKCAGEDLDYATPSDLVINEFMAYPDKTSTPTSFFTINGRNASQCHFIEVVNVSGKKLRLDQCSVTAERTDYTASVKKSTNALSGTIESKGVIVIHDCDSLALPTGTIEQNLASTSNIIQSGTYELYVTCDGVDGSRFTANKASSGVSMNLSKDLVTTIKTMSAHTSVTGSVAKASPGYCVNGGLFSENCNNHCGDGTRNGNETDTDCGGNICQKCAPGRRCSQASDCVSDDCLATGYCAEQSCVDIGCSAGYNCDTKTGKCVSCDDKEQNGDETGLDCGGSCKTACDSGLGCLVDSDCKSLSCSSSRICVGLPCETPKVGELLITEVLGTPNTSELYSKPNYSAQNEFIEIVNHSTHRVNLNGLILRVTRTDKTPNDVYDINLSGCLDSNNANVYVTKDTVIDGLPAGSQYVAVLKSNLIVNGSPYTISIVNASGVVLDSVIRAGNSATATKGVSQVRQPQLTGGSTLVLHNDSSVGSTLLNSPGYCSNGKLFTKQCQ